MRNHPWKSIPSVWAVTLILLPATFIFEFLKFAGVPSAERILADSLCKGVLAVAAIAWVIRLHRKSS